MGGGGGGIEGIGAGSHSGIPGNVYGTCINPSKPGRWSWSGSVIKPFFHCDGLLLYIWASKSEGRVKIYGIPVPDYHHAAMTFLGGNKGGEDVFKCENRCQRIFFEKWFLSWVRWGRRDFVVDVEMKNFYSHFFYKTQIMSFERQIIL